MPHCTNEQIRSWEGNWFGQSYQVTEGHFLFKDSSQSGIETRQNHHCTLFFAAYLQGNCSGNIALALLWLQVSLDLTNRGFWRGHFNSISPVFNGSLLSSSREWVSYTLMPRGLRVLFISQSISTLFLSATTNLILRVNSQVSLHCHCSLRPPWDY